MRSNKKTSQTWQTKFRKCLNKKVILLKINLSRLKVLAQSGKLHTQIVHKNVL